MSGHYSLFQTGSLILIFALIPVFGYSQSWSFIFKGGITLNSFTSEITYLDGKKENRIEESHPGFSMGYNIQYNFIERHAIKSGIEFQYRDAETPYRTFNGFNFNLYYLGIPVFYKYKVYRSLSLQGGILWDYLLAKDFNIIDFSDDEPGFLSFDFSIMGGLIYSFKNIEFGVMARRGLIEIIQNTDEKLAPIESIFTKSFGFELYTAYVFE